MFKDEVGNEILYDNYNAPSNANQLVALPSGHNYEFWVLNNGTASACTAGILHISVLAPNTGETCYTASRHVDERLEICCGDPDGTFFLPQVCNGCVVINPKNQD